MDVQTRIKRQRFRAWHRGTKEADLMIGGFFDREHAGWTAEQVDWFEALLDEEDVEIMGWALRTIPVPPRYEGPMMERMRRLDYIPVAE
ncbi:MAG TPA: succinate dehydrogenase assembly factor 2 [Sphingomonas sp.]|jgi:antitoxin CptB|uniref:FAD assembly factor SdhE n=1 Tax=Sphingomonas sp. TaxID=28214 RepID=UPI002EDBB533